MPPKNSSNINYMSKRPILYSCGTTGNLPCAASILIPDLTPNSVGSTESQCVTVESVSLIPNSNDSYEYMFTFSSSNPYNEYNTPPISINFFNVTTAATARFAFTYIAGTSTEPSSGFPVLAASPITTNNSSYNCYTINSGTYNVTFSAGSSSAPMCGGGALEFGPVGSDPLSQTITISN
jgi:hypothetical protein